MLFGVDMMVVQTIFIFTLFFIPTTGCRDKQTKAGIPN